MPLVAGTQLGQYEIRSPLGAGGMGEVYLARDTKLERTVALKVLSPEIAHDNRQMGRFVLEAKAASALSHPNVAHIYEIDEAEGMSFIATSNPRTSSSHRVAASRFWISVWLK